MVPSGMLGGWRTTDVRVARERRVRDCADDDPVMPALAHGGRAAFAVPVVERRVDCRAHSSRVTVRS